MDIVFVLDVQCFAFVVSLSDLSGDQMKAIAEVFNLSDWISRFGRASGTTTIIDVVPKPF